MQNEFTGVVERDGEWFIAYSPEVPGANGQGKTQEEALQSLSDAIALVLEDRREDGLRGVPSEAVRTTVTIRLSAAISCVTFAVTGASSSARAVAIPCGLTL